MPPERLSSVFPINLDASSKNNCAPPSPQASEAPPDIFDEDAAIASHFHAYEKVLHGQRLHFERVDSTTGEVRKIIVEAASTSRYTPAGRKKIRRKLAKRLSSQLTPGVLLTMTVDPKRHTKAEAWELLWPNYAVFRKSLWKYLQRQGWKSSPLYLAVIEQNKSGYPHLHVCYPGLRYLAPKEILNRAWRMGSTHVKGSRRGGSGVMVNALAYVLKYVTKLSGWTKDGLAHLWHARARLYNISPRLYQASKEPKVSSGWQLTKIDYVDDAVMDLARRLARLRLMYRKRTRRKEVLYALP